MNFFPVRVRRSARLILFSSLMFSHFAAAQTCLTAADMDEPARNALVSTAKKYFDMAGRLVHIGGREAGLRCCKM